MRVECESSKLTPRPLIKGRMAGHRWERPGSTASDRWKRLGPLAVGRGPADLWVRPNPRWATLLTGKAHCPSNGQKLLKLWCRPNFASKRCSNLFFKGFSSSEIFLDFCRGKCMMVKFVINYLGHDTNACSQISEGVREMLSPDQTGDGGAA